MSNRTGFFAEPIAYTLVLIACVIFAAGLGLVLGLLIVPIVLVGLGLFHGFRYWQLQRLRVQLPATPSGKVVYVTPDPSHTLVSPYPKPDRFAEDIHKELLAFFEKDTGRTSCEALSDTFTSVMMTLYEPENFHTPPDKPAFGDLISQATYQDRVNAWQAKISDPDIYNLFLDTACNSYIELRDHFPASAFQELSDVQTTIPFSIAMTPEQVNSFAAWFFQQPLIDNHLFEKLRQQILSNEEAIGSKGIITFDALFANTPFTQFSALRTPFVVPLDKQLEHSMIAAGSRYGKSQLIGSIIATHLQSENPPGIIVIDSTGDFAEKISQIALFVPGQRLEDRLLILDPADAPQLNMFDLSTVRAKGYAQADFEQIEADVIHMFNYVFASLGSELTAQQGTGFTFLIRLLLSIPGSNINTLRELLEIPARTYNDVPPPFRQAIERLDPTTQAYFRNQFFTLSMLPTRQGVARRLYGILQIPTFERMFSGANRVDFFQAMQEGKIIVVNTAKSLLQEFASALFGRYIIARVMSGAFERTVIKDMSKRRPCLLFIDEAQEYFDGSLDTLLTQIGKFKLGICVAFQYFGQMDDKLRASVLGNTTVKYAGGLSVTELRMIAKELRVDEQFVLSQRKDASRPSAVGGVRNPHQILNRPRAFAHGPVLRA